ncbi:adenylate kinase family enzyme [Bosea sp. BE125]|uniref:AAA family ATPase n=1 Tax=Bosea sp. BE125 TaxID=2817909 RepID=UPI00285FF32C|nr:AAA family ATPase [Bosea sp. BE125]MDR6869451.1 adenylate kinase family enzyme [Bosea sp. BE125]
MPRIHILGASGSGTTTLGEALGILLDVPHMDSDAFYWLPTDPPFQTPRPLSVRQTLLLDQLKPDASWILSGSALKWAQPLEPLYELIIYLRLDPALRMERLRKRELARYGERVSPNGDMAATSVAFLNWAAAYDTAGAEQRSRIAHEEWLATQTAPVLRLDSSKPVKHLAAAVQAAIQ